MLHKVIALAALVEALATIEHCRASRWKAIRPGNHFESIIASAGYMQHQVCHHLVFGTFQWQLPAGITSKPPHWVFTITLIITLKCKKPSEGVSEVL